MNLKYFVHYDIKEMAQGIKKMNVIKFIIDWINDSLKLDSWWIHEGSEWKQPHR